MNTSPLNVFVLLHPSSCIRPPLPFSDVCVPDAVFDGVCQALEAVNTRLREIYPESEELFDVVLMTNNHAYVGLRLINTINHHREFQHFFFFLPASD